MFTGTGPIYMQIAQQIRHDILSGALTEGEQVMSTTQYATTFRINPATAAKAFSLLVDEGIIHKQRGLGMFVSPGAQQRIRNQRRGEFLNSTLTPVIEDAQLLGLTREDVIAHINAVWGASGAHPTTTSTPDSEGGRR